MARPEKIGTIHEKAIRLRIEGKSSQEIADACGVKLQTVYEWFSYPLIKRGMQEALSKINEIWAERMAGLGVAAMEALLEMVKEQPTGDLTHNQRLEIIREVLDRTGNTKPSADEAPTNQPSVAVGFNFQNPTPSPVPQLESQPNLLEKDPKDMTDQDLMQAARVLSGQVIEMESDK